MFRRIIVFFTDIIYYIIYAIPCFHVVFLTSEDRYRFIKGIFGFIYGLLLGFAFYAFIIVDLEFTEYMSLLVGFIISILLAISIAISRQIRCIALLSLPAIGGSGGRSFLKAMVVTFIIAGPVSNIIINGKEVTRTFTCATTLTFNLTKTRFQLMFQPFQEALFGMKADAKEIKNTISSIRDVTAPLTGEIEGEAEMTRMKEENDYLDALLNDTKRTDEIAEKYNTTGEQIEAERYRQKYMEKIETRCEDQLTKASYKCRRIFSNLYDKCYDAVTWFAAWLICWPMKLTFVCNIVQSMGGPKVCDPSQEIDPGFGEGYTYLKSSGKKLFDNFKDVNFQYKIEKVKRYYTEARDAYDSSKMITHDVKRKKDIVEWVLRIFKRILAFIVLRVMFAAQTYHNKYTSDIKFDNIYITSYFRKIDARRKHQEKDTLFPLKKSERKKLIDPYSIRTMKQERRQIIGKLIKFALEVVLLSVFVILDYILCETLSLIHHHAEIKYIQEGHHDMMLEIKGTGFIANILRSIVKGFNIKKRVKIIRSNKVCLPQPNLLPLYYYYKIYGTFLGILLLIFMEAYLNRIRRWICGYYYRKQEKKRVLFVYNETLKRRMGFIKHTKRKVMNEYRKYRAIQQYSIFAAIRIRYPNLAGCLRILPATRQRCFICEDPEPFFQTNSNRYVICYEPGCYAIYCQECWYDIGEICFVCQVEEDEDSDYESDDSDDDYSD